MEHTNGKWEIQKHGTPEYAPQYGIYAGDGSKPDFAMTKGENAEANARHICQCVNHFDELLDAVKASQQMMEWAENICHKNCSNGYVPMMPNGDPEPCEWCILKKQLEQAIQNAEKGE